MLFVAGERFEPVLVPSKRSVFEVESMEAAHADHACDGTATSQRDRQCNLRSSVHLLSHRVIRDIEIVHCFTSRVMTSSLVWL